MDLYGTGSERPLVGSSLEELSAALLALSSLMQRIINGVPIIV